MANSDLLATKMPLYLSAGTKKITIGVTSSSTSPYPYPTFSAAVADTNITSVSPFAGADLSAGIANFKAWWMSNPFYVTRLNIRATSTANLPSQVIIKTPDIFTGTMQTQIVDIGANFVSTQFQSSIVTIDNLDLFVSRNSEIEVVGGSTAASQVLYLDFTIRAFISLEFCLQQSILSLAASNEDLATIVSAVDNEGTKTAILDPADSSSLTSTKRAQILAALKANTAKSDSEQRAALRKAAYRL